MAQIWFIGRDISVAQGDGRASSAPVGPARYGVDYILTKTWPADPESNNYTLQCDTGLGNWEMDSDSGDIICLYPSGQDPKWFLVLDTADGDIASLLLLADFSSPPTGLPITFNQTAGVHTFSLGPLHHLTDVPSAFAVDDVLYCCVNPDAGRASVLYTAGARPAQLRMSEGQYFGARYVWVATKTADAAAAIILPNS